MFLIGYFMWGLNVWGFVFGGMLGWNNDGLILDLSYEFWGIMGGIGV